MRQIGERRVLHNTLMTWRESNSRVIRLVLQWYSNVTDVIWTACAKRCFSRVFFRRKRLFDRTKLKYPHKTYVWEKWFRNAKIALFFFFSQWALQSQRTAFFLIVHCNSYDVICLTNLCRFPISLKRSFLRTLLTLYIFTDHGRIWPLENNRLQLSYVINVTSLRSNAVTCLCLQSTCGFENAVFIAI